MTKIENKLRTKGYFRIFFAESKRILSIIFLLAVLIGVIVLAGAAAGYGVYYFIGKISN